MSDKLSLDQSVLSRCLVSITGEEVCGGSWSFHSPGWKWHSFYWLLLSFPYLLWLPSILTQTRGMKVRESSLRLVSISFAFQSPFHMVWLLWFLFCVWGWVCFGVWCAHERERENFLSSSIKNLLWHLTTIFKGLRNGKT